MPQDKVLIVDDDLHILRMASRILQSDGIATTEVSSGREALNQILYSHYDLVLLDINLDDLDGFSIVKKVRAQGISTPIIIISGNTEEYNTIFGLGIGSDDYLANREPCYPGGQGQGPDPAQPHGHGEQREGPGARPLLL